MLLKQLQCVKTILLAPSPRSAPGPFQIVLLVWSSLAVFLSYF